MYVCTYITYMYIYIHIGMHEDVSAFVKKARNDAFLYEETPKD